MGEQWNDVVGFEAYFQVSSDGVVYSKRTGRILRQVSSKKGYKTVSTRIGGRAGKCFCFKVHRLVADAFLEPAAQSLLDACKLQGHGRVLVRHMDGDKANNCASNLAWGTAQDNADDFKASPNFHIALEKRSGCKNVHAKADLALVQKIRARYKRGCRINGARALAAEFGVHHTNIARLASARSYK